MTGGSNKAGLQPVPWLPALVGIASLILVAVAAVRAFSPGSPTTGFLIPPLNLPNLQVTDLDGRRISLESSRGRVVLVNFWATWCGPCRQEIPDLKTLRREFSESLDVLGISTDTSPEGVRTFVKDIEIDYPVVLAAPSVWKTFPPVESLPTTFLLDRDGRLAKVHVGRVPIGEFRREISALSNPSRH